MIGNRKKRESVFGHRHPVQVRLVRVFGSAVVLSGIAVSAFVLEPSLAAPSQLASSNTNATAQVTGGFEACSGADYSLGNAGYFGLYVIGANRVPSSVSADDTTGAAAFGGIVRANKFVVNNNNVGASNLYKGLALYAPHAVDTAPSNSYAFIIDGGDYNTNLAKGEVIANNDGHSSTTTVPIASDNRQLDRDSASWGALLQSGGATVESHSTSLSLVGTNSTLNVFDLTAGDLTALNSRTTVSIKVPDKSTVLINVPGKTPNLSAITSMSLDGVRASMVLWNFDAATNVSIFSRVQWEGAFLAPHASLTGSSQMDGNVVVNAFTESSSSEVHGDTKLFVGCITPSGPVQPAMLSIAKLVSLTPATAGSASYTSTTQSFAASAGGLAYFEIEVANNSTQSVSVNLSDPLVAGFTVPSSATVSCASSSGVCPSGDTPIIGASGIPSTSVMVPAGTTLYFTFSETALANTATTAATYTNTATITSPTDGSCTPVSTGVTGCSTSVSVTVPAASPVTSPSTTVVSPPTSPSVTKPVTSSGSTVVVPTTHTGEPWSGDLWWIGFGGLGILGGAILTDGYRRKRRIA